MDGHGSHVEIHHIRNRMGRWDERGSIYRLRLGRQREHALPFLSFLTGRKD